MKITRRKLRQIIKEELLLEQSRREVDPEEFERLVQSDQLKRGRDPIYQLRAKDSGIYPDEEGRLSSFGTRIETADGMTYRHDNIRLNDEGQWAIRNGSTSFSPLEKLVIGATASASDKKTASTKPKAKEPPPPPKYEPRSWTDDPSSTKSSVDARWFPDRAKLDPYSSDYGAFSYLVYDDGDGPWYTSPDMGGLNQEHHGRTGWVWWKMTDSGIYYTPKKPGGIVGDFTDPNDPDIGFARLDFNIQMPKNYVFKGYDLGSIYFRHAGEEGLGVDGSLDIAGTTTKAKIAVATLERLGQLDDKRQDGLADWKDLERFLKSVVQTGSGRLRLDIDAGKGQTVPFTLIAG